MPSSSQRIHNLDELKQFVISTLCNHDQLEVDAFPVTQRILVRSGRPCGIFFCLHGPRSVKFTAVWETERNTVLFYGSTGERFMKTQLTSAPCLEMVAN